jgi:SAM-dependent methyltransferase
MPRGDTERFYRNALARYGENAEGAHWHSTEAQQLRYEVLYGLLPADLGTLTLLDVGCGLGDLHGFLAERGALPRRYIGIDCVEPMVEIARRRTGCPILKLDVLTDPLPRADISIACGSMTLLTPAETRLFIERCLAASRIGLVCNLLQGRDHSGTFNQMLPAQMSGLAAELGVTCRIVDDYLSYDFTAALTHPRAG